MMKYIFIFFSAFIIHSCANVVVPQGGPRDTTPPKQLTHLNYPDSNNLTNFTGKNVILTFDEPFQLSSFQQNFTSNPSFNRLPTYEIKKRKKNEHQLLLTFQEALQENSTYKINLPNTIRDLTESNTVKNIEIVFSTGPFIDSLEVNGQILDHLTRNGLGQNFVGLYAMNDTIDPSKHKPIYFTYSDPGGQFSFDYIKSGSYNIVTFSDKNSNQLLDIKTEPIAFQTQPLKLNTNTEVELVSFLETLDSIKIQTVQNRLENTKITTNTEIESDTIQTQSSIYYELNEDRKSLTFLNTSDNPIPVRIQLRDESNNLIDTTVSISAHIQNSREQKPLILNQTYDNQHVNVIEMDFKSTGFISNINESLIYVAQSDDTLSLSNFDYGLALDKYSKGFKISLEPSTTHISDTTFIIIKKGAIESPVSKINNTQIFMSTKYDPANYGVLEGRIVTNHSSYTFELMNSKNEVIKTLSNPKGFLFTYLKPDTYNIRIKQDSNDDGVFEKGSYTQRVQPDPVYIYPTPIVLKANWEIRDISIQF